MAEGRKWAGDYGASEKERKLPSLGLVPDDKRSPFEKDRDRIIHSAAFRRLQGKTQVFGLGGSDFFRTRLTHSLETAQIGKGLALECGFADTDLVEAICLAHDIGHPPYGHTGEEVLKIKMKDFGGFEANAQNFRILSKLEIRTARLEQEGINLTRATIDGLLKYKKPYSEVEKNTPLTKWKFYYDEDKDLVKWAIDDAPQTTEPSYECEIMDWADEIAYSTHDLEDGIKAGMISKAKVNPRIEHEIKQTLGPQWSDDIWEDVVKDVGYASDDSGIARVMKGRRKDLVSHLITGFVKATHAERRTRNPKSSRYEYHLKIDDDWGIKCKMLNLLVWGLIIDDERVSTLERRAKLIVARLFDELTKFDDDRQTRTLYPLDFRERLDQVESDLNLKDREKECMKKRTACDFIAGMTDAYAERIYSRLTGGEQSSLMDII